MSGNELMLALSNEVETNERYEMPALFTHAGVVDRRHENGHALAIRDCERQAREAVAAAAVEVVADIAWIEGRARVNTEAKYLIERAAKESRILAQDDPVVETKFAVLDDEFFNQSRTRANKPDPKAHGRLF